MFSRHFGAVLAAFAILFLPASGAGQHRTEGKDIIFESEDEGAAGNRTGSGPDKRILTGRVVDMRLVHLRGEGGRHVLAKISSGDDGKNVVVDLGPAWELRRSGLRLRKGQEVSVLGRRGSINGKPVLVSTRLRSDDGQETGTRSMRPAGRSFAGFPGWMGEERESARRGRPGKRPLPPFEVVNGRVADEVSTATFRGIDGQRRLLKLRSFSGEVRVVELGRSDQLRDVQFQKGELLSVIGRRGTINGRPVLFAGHVSNFLTIDRSADRQAQRELHRRKEGSRGTGKPGASAEPTTSPVTGTIQPPPPVTAAGDSATSPPQPVADDLFTTR